jgi:hypothetical protein
LGIVSVNSDCPDDLPSGIARSDASEAIAERRFAGAARPEQRQHLALTNGQVDAEQRGLFATRIAEAKSRDVDQGALRLL